MTPDNLPFLGASRHAKLWFNCWHCAKGSAMVSGSSQGMANLVACRIPPVDPHPYRWVRYGSLHAVAYAAGNRRYCVWLIWTCGVIVV